MESFYFLDHKWGFGHLLDFACFLTPLLFFFGRSWRCWFFACAVASFHRRPQNNTIGSLLACYQTLDRPHSFHALVFSWSPLTHLDEYWFKYRKAYARPRHDGPVYLWIQSCKWQPTPNKEQEYNDFVFDGKLNRIKPTICIEVENKDFAQNWAEGQKELWCVKHQKLHFIDIYKAMKHMFKIMYKYQLTMICLLALV